MRRAEDYLSLTLDEVKQARDKGQKVSLKWKGEDLEQSRIRTKDGSGRMQKVKRRFSVTIEIE